jgi:hypothetical protein
MPQQDTRLTARSRKAGLQLGSGKRVGRDDKLRLMRQTLGEQQVNARMARQGKNGKPLRVPRQNVQGVDADRAG